MCQNKINSIIKIYLAKTFWKKLGKILLVLALLGFSQLLVLSAASFDLFRYMLPITLPSKVVFVDEITRLPIKGVRVRFTWEGSRGYVGSYGGSWTYYEKDLVTDKDGAVQLPVRLKPFPVLLLPLYMSGHSHITVTMATWKYKPLKYLNDFDPYGSDLSLFGSEIKPIIKVKPLPTPDAQLSELTNNSLIFGNAFWNKELQNITKENALNLFSVEGLLHAANYCSKRVWQRCEIIDREILRRNNNKGDTEWAEYSALRLGIVTPAMRKRAEKATNNGRAATRDDQIDAIKATDPTLEIELLKRFRKPEFEKLTATQMHAEGKKIFNTGNYEMATALWLIELEKEPQNANTMNNISIGFECMKQYLKSDYWAKKALKIDRNFAHAHISRGFALIGLGSNSEAAEEIKKGISLGYEDADTHMNLLHAYYMGGNRTWAEKEAKLIATKYPNYPKLNELLKEYSYKNDR